MADEVKRGKRWFDLPKEHPIRLWHTMNATRKALRYAKAAMDDECGEAGYIDRKTDLERAQRKYDKAHEAWENAGCPNRFGKETR